MSTMRSVYTNLCAARTVIKDMARLRQIAGVLVRHGFGHVVEAWHLQDKAVLNLLVSKRDAEVQPLSLFERIVLVLQELGPTFVKLGQILSTRPDLIPQALCDELKSLQDNVAPITLAEARAVVEASIGGPIEEAFTAFSDKPLACASIAQVHIARLPTGEEVVVKIQRPGIADVIDSDLHILYFIARNIEATIPEAQAFDPTAIAKEFDRAISRELDFGFELRNLERFARNFADWDTIHIPRPYPELSGTRVLVMERLRGHKITDAAAHGHDMDFVARETVRMLFKQVFEDGFFHGDLHPGNLFVLEGNRLGVIDFGLVGRMSQAMKDTMADLLLHIVSRDEEGVARSLFDISIRSGRVNYAEWEADVSDLLAVHFAHASLADVDFGAILRDLVEGAIRHNVRVPPDYTMFFKALMTVEGIGKIVSPDLDLVEECRPYVERLIAARYGPERVMRTAVDTARALGRLGRMLPGSAQRFLESLEEGYISLGVRPEQLAEIESGRDRRLNRAVVAALSATLLVCGTLMRNDGGPRLLGAPVLTTISYGLGGLLLLRLLWRVRSDGRW